MQRVRCLGVLVSVLCPSLWPMVGNAQDAEVLYRRAVQGLIRTTFEANGSVQSSSGAAGEFRLRQSFVDGTIRIWIEVQKPNELRGQRFLLWNRLEGKNEGWWYDPKNKKVQELDSAAWRQPFLKSEFLLGDFLFVGTSDHKIELGGEENYGGQTFAVVHLYAKEAANALYPHRVYSIDPRQNLLVRAMYFDAQEKPVKRWLAERIERRGSEWFPAEQRVLLLSGNQQASTTLRLTGLKFEPELPRDAFEPSALGSPARK